MTSGSAEAAADDERATREGVHEVSNAATAANTAVDKEPASTGAVMYEFENRIPDANPSATKREPRG